MDDVTKKTCLSATSQLTLFSNVPGIVYTLYLRCPTNIFSLHFQDGVLNDFDEVMEKFVSISHLPLTVVFAGVGLADLSHMVCPHKVLFV